MKFEDVYKILSGRKFFVFSVEDVRSFFPKEKKDAISQCLSRWKKSGFVVTLRRGLYELVFPERHSLSDIYLANKVYAPSYVSLETALSHYSLIPEVSMTAMSITSRTTRRFKNHHGLFVYRSVQPKAFCGYTVEIHGGFEVLIAEPEKALADWLYLASLTPGKFDPKVLRLDRKRVARLDRKKLACYGAIYGIDPKEMLRACI